MVSTAFTNYSDPTLTGQRLNSHPAWWGTFLKSQICILNQICFDQQPSRLNPKKHMPV